MLPAVLIPVVATALGTALALGARRLHWVFEPVRSFALAAVTVTIATHLMPEALDEAGPWALVVLAAGLVLPGAFPRPAIAQGSRVVEYGDKRVEYRTLDEMLRTLGLMERTLGINNTGAGRRVGDYYSGKE